jgi:hypothetical protein
MDIGFVLLVLSFPVFALVLLSVWVYVDAPYQGMDRRKWAAATLLLPLVGFFAYLLERAERKDELRDEMFADGTFEIHESRADDTPLAESSQKLGPDELQRQGENDSEETE